LVFGATANPVAFRYTELYNLDTAETYVVQNRILDGSGKVLKDISTRKKYGIRDAVEIGSMVVAAIPSGRYRFQLSLADTNKQLLATSERDIYIYNPQIKAGEYAVARPQMAGLSGLTTEELEQEFSTLHYFVSEQDERNFSQITSADGRRQFLTGVWSQIESGRTGRPPVTRSEFLRRVSSANLKFHGQGRVGWKSDRGRVYLLYGDPDDIERYPNALDSKPYEIWHYYHIESGVEFDFVDRSGFGDYILVNSTKRGEIADDQWKRFLQ
jgi:GWxTD domain-containing protein